MKLRVLIALLGIVATVCSFATAEDDAPAKPAAATPVDPEVVRVHLMDGSVLTGKLSVKEIELETKFGLLKVPVMSIRSFTPGLASHPELDKHVYNLIDKLGAGEYDQRELAQKELLKMGEPVRPALEKYVADADKERRDRVKAIIEELDDARDDEEDKTPHKDWLIPNDSVETTEFTALGKIITPQLTVLSLYGPLTVKLSDVRRMERETNKKTNLVKNVAVDGSNLVQRTLKDTGIRVERGDKVTITAEGSLTMTPWGNGSTSSPDGDGNFGWLVQNSIPGGALVATFGNSTAYLKVGSKATLRATKSGPLRLGIAMQRQHASQEFPGGYEVKIVVEPK
jgi:hypothetical protein